MKFTIGNKITFIILIIILPMATFSFYHYFEVLGEEKGHIQADNLQIARNIASGLDETIDETIGIMRVLALHSQVMERESQGTDRLFAGLLPTYPYYLNMLAADMHGNN